MVRVKLCGEWVRMVVVVVVVVVVFFRDDEELVIVFKLVEGMLTILRASGVALALGLVVMLERWIAGDGVKRKQRVEGVVCGLGGIALERPSDKVGEAVRSIRVAESGVCAEGDPSERDAITKDKLVSDTTVGASIHGERMADHGEGIARGMRMGCDGMRRGGCLAGADEGSAEGTCALLGGVGEGEEDICEGACRGDGCMRADECAEGIGGEGCSGRVGRGGVGGAGEVEEGGVGARGVEEHGEGARGGVVDEAHVERTRKGGGGGREGGADRVQDAHAQGEARVHGQRDEEILGVGAVRQQGGGGQRRGARDGDVARKGRRRQRTQQVRDVDGRGRAQKGAHRGRGQQIHKRLQQRARR